MITLELLCEQVSGLEADVLRDWVLAGYVRADTQPEGFLHFQEIDVARVRLILDLRENLALNDDALPVVLSLLDQLYALRRRLGEG